MASQVMIVEMICVGYLDSSGNSHMDGEVARVYWDGKRKCCSGEVICIRHYKGNMAVVAAA
jgi:hypothetical protein